MSYRKKTNKKTSLKVVDDPTSSTATSTDTKQTHTKANNAGKGKVLSEGFFMKNFFSYTFGSMLRLIVVALLWLIPHSVLVGVFYFASLIASVRIVPQLGAFVSQANPITNSNNVASYVVSNFGPLLFLLFTFGFSFAFLFYYLWKVADKWFVKMYAYWFPLGIVITEKKINSYVPTDFDHRHTWISTMRGLDVVLEKN